MENFKRFSKEELLNIYYLMYLSRQLDERQVMLLRQGKAFFHIGGPGHEGAQVAAAKAMRPGYDWAFPYYRDQSFCLAWGFKPEEILLQFLAKKNDICSGGRQMPAHWSHPQLRIPTQSACVATQYLQATGLAMGIKKMGKDEVVYVSGGEGSTSEGEFHEALNWASIEKLPVLFHVEDNYWAISVPLEEQVAGGSVYKVVAGYENLEKYEVDGTDFFETFDAFEKAVQRARKGEGPSVIVSKVVRLFPHSSSDDHRKYRTPEELEADKKKDPILRFFHKVVDAGLLKVEELEAMEDRAKSDLEKALNWALEQEDPDPATSTSYVFVQNNYQEEKTPSKEGETVVMVDAINHCLAEEMERNEKILVYGEDVADPKGGVFTVTKGLTKRFGKERVFNSPLAEATIVGTAIGLAFYGFKPVVEIQFMDYIWPAFQQIRNELGVIHYRSNGSWKVPVVIRVPVGGFIHGGLYHSQSAEALFLHCPGLRVVYPSNAADAKGLLKMAIRGEDPVLFLEHKGIYRQRFAARPEPDADYIIPFGNAKVLREGEDMTLITWGLQVHLAQKAIENLGLEGSVELIDLRTLQPWDEKKVINSVKKTGKVLIVHEDNKTCGFGAEIAARIAEEAFEYLDAPIIRVAAKDTPIPYAEPLENNTLPTENTIKEAIEKLLKY